MILKILKFWFFCREKQSKENDVLEKAEENEDVENRDDDADDEEEQY